jgi:primosomal protein N' (replication factor Y) (superfamily II helicase)
MVNSTNRLLFILMLKGLYRVTICKKCNHVFRSPESDVNLIAYRVSSSKLELVDPTTQKTYSYPNQCPKCSESDIISFKGGVDELVEVVERELGIPVHRYDKSKRVSNIGSNVTWDIGIDEIAVTTRLYDPSIEYGRYNNIMIVGAEQMGSSLEYRASEEVMIGLFSLLMRLRKGTNFVVDTRSIDTSFMQFWLKNIESGNIINKFYSEELEVRKVTGFPPFKNILLLTTQEKNKSLAQSKLSDARKIIINAQLSEVSISSVYPARMLRRKGYYSYHTVVTFPRQYQYFDQLKVLIHELCVPARIQTRLNPRHIL